ncbi:MAG: TerB family tellurite resistance protein [Armatimonadetes bacterium]|nr:TerB family tellurite resistance protein [Armatimonadota bacterium]
MSLWTRVVEWLVSDSRLSSLSEDQSKAVIRALVLCAEADGKITDEEWERLYSEIKRLPWRWHHHTPEVNAIISEFRRSEKELQEAGGTVVDEIREVSAQLPEDPVARLAIYRMLVSVCWFDGLAPVEHEVVLTEFRKQLGISDEDGEKTLQSVRDETLPNLG